MYILTHVDISMLVDKGEFDKVDLTGHNNTGGCSFVDLTGLSYRGGFSSLR